MMRRFSCLLVSLLCVACIRAPEIVVVDHATALEQQAGGSFPELEEELLARALSASPVALTPNQLETLGLKPRALVDRTEQTEADILDALLKQHCIGEGNDGLLKDTYEDCSGASDRAVNITLIDRTNRAREQLFRYMQSQQPESSVSAIKRAWHTIHLQGVVCGGLIQRQDGSWEAKPC